MPEAKTAATTPETPPAAFVDTTKVALYSKYGGRKTLQIAGLIEMVGPEHVLVVSADKGLNTVRSYLKPEMVITVNNMSEVRSAWAKAEEFSKQGKHRWIVLDGASQAMQWLSNDQFAGADAFYELFVKKQEMPDRLKPFGRYMSDKGNLDAMKIYNRVGRDSENLLNAWTSLPCNLYFNYLEDKTESNGYEKTIPWGPDVPGRVGLRAVMSKFDYVMRLGFNPDGKLTAYMDSKSNVYLARTRDDRKLVELPTEWPDFSLADFVRKVTAQPEPKVSTAAL